MKPKSWLILGGVMTAALVAMVACSTTTTRAEDYCYTDGHPSASDDAVTQAAEDRLRARCKSGDLIYIRGSEWVARLCDLQKPVVSMGYGDIICALAPPRKIDQGLGPCKGHPYSECGLSE